MVGLTREQRAAKDAALANQTPNEAAATREHSRTSLAALRDARDELRDCAELVKALVGVDASGDLTKPSWKRAREALRLASNAYCAAHDAHFAGTPETRRAAERAAGHAVKEAS